MKNDEWRDKPIELQILPYTGRVDGDDSGYRDLKVQENLDPMVVVPPKIIKQELVYAKGPVKGLCPYYEGTLGAKPVAFVRKPVLGLLIMLDTLLRDFGYSVLLVDAWRSTKTQAELFNNLFRQGMKKEGFTSRDQLTVADILRLGDAADKIGSYSAPELNHQFVDGVFYTLQQSPRGPEIYKLAQLRGERPVATAERLLTYEANIGWQQGIELSRKATTAHGSGGATDLYMFKYVNSYPECLGVPFDYAGEASRIDYFEHEENFDKFQEEVGRDPLLKQYLTECGFNTASAHNCRIFGRARRILYHAATSLGATVYVEEPWHFNWPCGHGDYPHSGNSCQAILKNAPVAMWGNEHANTEVHTLQVMSKAFP